MHCVRLSTPGGDTATMAAVPLSVPPVRLLKTAAAGRTVAASCSSQAAMLHTAASPSSPSPPPSRCTESPTTDWDLADLIQQYATQHDGEEGEDEGDEENVEDEDEQKEEQQQEEESSALTRTGSMNRERSGEPSAGTLHASAVLRCVRRSVFHSAVCPFLCVASGSLLPTTRFLGNMLRSALSHNERVEHVGAMRGGADDAVDIEVLDPRGTFSALSSTKQQQRLSRNTASRQLTSSPGSLEAEAQKLIDAFEGGNHHRAGVSSSSVRKVRGRGRVLAHSAAAASCAATDNSSMSGMVNRRSSSGERAGTGTVAASHLHTDAQRAAYAVAHAKYRRARGVTLLHHIARAYAISIVIQPATSGSGGEEQHAQADADLEAEAKAAASFLQAHAAAASAAAPSSSSTAAAAATPASSAVARPTRIFSHSLANIGQAPTVGTRIASNVAAAAAAAVSNVAGIAAAPVLAAPPPASSSTSSGGKVRITLQRTSMANAMAAAAAPLASTATADLSTPTSAAAAAPAVVPRATFRRTFDAPLTAAPLSVASTIAPPSITATPVAAAAAASAAPIRKVVCLVRSNSVAATVPASSSLPPAPLAPASSASVRSVVVTGSSQTMSDRKRKLQSVEPDAAILASSPSPPAVSVAAAPRSLSSAAASSASLPLSKRKRTGGILGAALQGIMGGSAW